MNKNLLLAIGITILFLGIAVQPSIATVQPEQDIIDIEPKDYLFQTIIDIANNPEIKNLLKQNNHDLFTSDYDYKKIYSELLVRNPRLLFSMLFTKPSKTYNYLEKCYNDGIEITKIIGEHEVARILESIDISDIELFDEINNIITKNDVLSNRISLLKDLNYDLKSNKLWDNYPIICSILFAIMIYEIISGYLLAFFLEIIGVKPIISMFFTIIGIIKYFIGNAIVILIFKLPCIDPPNEVNRI